MPAGHAGYEDYDSIAYELEIYLLNSIDVQSVSLGPEHVLGTVQTMQKLLRSSVRPATHLQTLPACRSSVPPLTTRHRAACMTGAILMLSAKANVKYAHQTQARLAGMQLGI